MNFKRFLDSDLRLCCFASKGWRTWSENNILGVQRIFFRKIDFLLKMRMWFFENCVFFGDQVIVFRQVCYNCISSVHRQSLRKQLYLEFFSAFEQFFFRNFGRKPPVGSWKLYSMCTKESLQENVLVFAKVFFSKYHFPTSRKEILLTSAKKSSQGCEKCISMSKQ